MSFLDVAKSQLTVIEKTDIGQIGDLGSSLLEFVESLAILHDPVPFALCIAEKIDLVLAAGSRIGLGLEVATTTAHEDIYLRTEWVRISNLMLGDLLVRVTVSDVGSVTSRSGVVDGGGDDKAGLEALHLRCLENGAYRLAIIIDSNS